MPLSSVELPLLLEMQKNKMEPTVPTCFLSTRLHGEAELETVQGDCHLAGPEEPRTAHYPGQRKRRSMLRTAEAQPGVPWAGTRIRNTHTHILRVWSGAFSPDCSNMEWIGKNVQDWGSFEKALTPRVKRGCQAIFVSAIGSALSRGRVEFERSCSRPRAQS